MLVLSIPRYLVLSCLLAWPGSLDAQAQERATLPGFAFKGRLLVAVSDTDMLASAYIDGRLGPSKGPDMLSVIRLDRPPAEMRAVAVEVSNSVAGPPQSVAVTPDGRTAVVVETYGPRPPGKPDATMKELAPGHAITVVDLGDPDHPKVVQRMEGFEHPLSVSINADGTLVAVALGTPASSSTRQPPLVIYSLKDGRLSEPASPDVPGFQPDDAFISAEFHPKDDVLALVYGAHPRLSFVRVKRGRDGVSLGHWGNDVGLDHRPFLVRFTPDGRHAIVNDMYYGPDVRDVAGTLLSVAVAVETAPDGSPRHFTVSHVAADHDPEGLAVSPDGRWVVTTNLEHSSEPLTGPRQGFFSSLTLFRLNPETGRLDRVGVFPFDGVLPEAAVFDNTSRFLAVTSFDRFDGAAPGGSIDFWRLVEDVTEPGRALLVKTNYSVPVIRGPQSMAIIR